MDKTNTITSFIFASCFKRERDCFIFLLHCFIFKTWTYLAYTNSWINTYWVLDHWSWLRLYVCDLRSWRGPYRCQAREWIAKRYKGKLSLLSQPGSNLGKSHARWFILNKFKHSTTWQKFSCCNKGNPQCTRRCDFGETWVMVHVTEMGSRNRLLDKGPRKILVGSQS